MNNDKIEQLVTIYAPDVEILMLCKFGSHLYGTDTPESDTDLKGIFMPTAEQICLGKIPKSINISKNKVEGERNNKEDVDFELYSLHYFLKLACQGETAALDMLHVNVKNLLMTSSIWRQLQSHRKLFYTKNLKAFVGYARKQAAKYGIKGSRLAAAKEFVDVCQTASPETKLSTVWGALPVNDHARHIDSNPDGILQYQICGKIVQNTVTVQYAAGILERFVKQYGKRAKLAEKNEGVDFKAVSHAMRAAYQLREILTTGDLIFPLKQAEHLKQIKLGKMHYATEVALELESLMEDLETLIELSILPEKVNVKFWEAFLISTTIKTLKGEQNV